MTAVLKYEIPLNGDASEVVLPADAKFLSVSVQRDKVQSWWEVWDTHANAPKLKRTFRVVATGQQFDSAGWKYLGTFFPGEYVFHLYQQVNKDPK